MSYGFAVCTVKKTPDDGQMNCPKHVEFHSKNKFEKLVHLVGFIIRIYHDAARSTERQTNVIVHLPPKAYDLCVKCANKMCILSLYKSSSKHFPFR